MRLGKFLRKFGSGQFSLTKTFLLYGLLPLAIWHGLIVVAIVDAAPILIIHIMKLPAFIYVIIWIIGTYESAAKHKGCVIWKIIVLIYISLVAFGLMLAILRTMAGAPLII